MERDYGLERALAMEGYQGEMHIANRAVQPEFFEIPTQSSTYPAT